MPHERTQEIDSISARDLPCDLARDLDIASPIDEEAGSTERESRAGEWRGCGSQSTVFDNLQEHSRSFCDSVVVHGSMLEEGFHQPIYEGDLTGDLVISLARYRFQGATKESIDVTGQ